MLNQIVKKIGKTFFWLFFILGNVCFFGYYTTKMDDFAYAGYVLLIFGTIINSVVFLGLILLGIFCRKYSENAFKSAMVMLINIPIAILYAWIGLTFH